MASKLAVMYQQDLPFMSISILLFQLSHYDPVLAAPAWRPAKFCHNPGEDWVLHSGIGVHLSRMRWVERVLLEERYTQARTQDEKAALHYYSQHSREPDVSLGPVAGIFTSLGVWSFLSFTAERHRLTHKLTQLYKEQTCSSVSAYKGTDSSKQKGWQAGTCTHFTCFMSATPSLCLPLGHGQHWAEMVLAPSIHCRWLLQLLAIFWIWLCWRRQVETATLKEWGF